MARKKPVTTLNRLQPGTSGHNLAVRVLEKEVVIDRRDGSGEHLKIEECVVGDGTGRFTVSVRNDQCDQMEVSDTVELRNAKIRMHNGHMRLVIDRWGLIIENSSREVADEIPKENFSDVEYELRD